MTGRRRPGGPSGDPLAGVERVYIDGSNLLHALARWSARPGSEPAPAGAIIGRLRAAFPPSVAVDLIFDGPPSGGIKGRLATGLRVSYSGRISADRVIDEGVAAQFVADGPAGTWGILVVTDDRGLRDAVGSKGARTAGTAWLAGRIGRAVLDLPGPRVGPGSGGGGGVRRAGTGVSLPKAGTTFGHRRPPRASMSEEE
ncbi:MAG: hypothetical protein C0498_08905 [Anaerolinea sp.]|nr:hypothetical protein [Anaerolinea sp.]